ncbi:MAG TPA: 30S ribosomal protein S6 [Solirubrobacteraceae bacterium]|nr:30S ribosomal protein S6 [Solirubrobacteraceae bacterium]
MPATTYDLVLLLDPQAEQPARTKIVSDTKAAIEAHGELTRHDEWGERALAYPIDHRATAEYHLLQFHATQSSLIAELNRVLHITDGVIRFRINKLGPGTPEAPDLKSDRGSSAPPPASGRGGSSPAQEEGERARAEEHAAA